MKPALFSAWQTWALLSACFAALTAIFAKVGVENINPDLATFIRTIVVLLAFSVLCSSPANSRCRSAVSSKTWLFLVLSGLATGASWLCYFRALKLGRRRWWRRSTSSASCWSPFSPSPFSANGRLRQGWLGIAMIGAGAVLLAVKF